MVWYYPEDANEFLGMVEELCRPYTHVLTYNDDGRVYEIALAPKVTSNHRHYVVYRTPSKEEFEELLGKLKAMGFRPRRAAMVKSPA